jgi:hypothetical protein
MRVKSTKDQIDDNNLQFIVLLTLIIEKVEFLEQNGYLFGTIKQFLKNSKTRYEDFIAKVFSLQNQVDGNTATDATNKLFVMQERVEKALINEYMLTVDERKQRTSDILSKYMTKPMLDKAMMELEDKNSFNF